MRTQRKPRYAAMFSLLLVIALLMGLVPATVLAAEEGTPSPRIVSYNYVLDGILSVNFHVDAQGQSMDGYSLRVKLGDDVQNITDYTKDGELYVYTAKVMAHRLGEPLSVCLMNGETEVQSKTKTLADYITSQKALHPDDSALHGLLDAMQSYGSYAAYYKDNSIALTAVPAVEAVSAADLAGYAPTIAVAGSAALGATASLYLDEACDLRVKFNAAAAEGYTLYVDGEAVTMDKAGSKLVYALSELLPQNWDTFYQFELKDTAGNTVYQLSYSVLSYIRTVLKNNGSEDLAGLLKSMYLYWSKAESYLAASGSGDTPILGITLPIVTENDVLTQAVGYENILIPAGVKVEPGLTELTVSVAKKADSDSGLATTDTQTLNAFDVHIEGIAADNTVPAQVALTEVLPKNLNSSALQICHVEDGQTVAMEYVASNEPLAEHNQFHYDPATGDLTVALASFSEIAVVADTANPWDGTADKSWYEANATEYTIRNAQQLAGFAQIATTDTFAGKTVRLAADIDLSGHTFYPIGAWEFKNGAAYGADEPKAFAGTFDGTGHTVANLNQRGWDMAGGYSEGYYNETMGLFGYLKNATVRNLTLNNFFCQMEYAPMGTVAGLAEGTITVSNIAVTNAEMWSYNTAVAGVIGWDVGENSAFNFTNITVDGTNTVHALWGTWDAVAGGIMGCLAENSSANFNNCHVSCVMDVYNDFCGNYQWGIYRYCGMFIGAVKKTTTDGDRQVCDLTNVTATDCTVNFGDWSKQYYYCEFEKNSMASYSPHYQFSRVPFEDITITDGVATCNHDHTEAEDQQAWQFVFDAAFGSWGNWGVTPVQANGYDGINISDTTGSIQKFAAQVTGTAAAPYAIEPDSVIAVGSLFQAVDGTDINNSGVYVSVTKVNQDDTASGTYAANADAWADGTLTFTGNGLLKLTIQDYALCTPTELYVSVTERTSAEKFALVFENTDIYLYRVGNANAVALSSLFSAIDGAEIDAANVAVTVEKLDEATDVAGTYTANSTDWTQGKIQFAGTGPVALTITDKDYCEPLTLNLEVVDGKNVTTVASATANNVVLLNDVSGSFSVSNGYTFYGNGFKVTLPKDTYQSKYSAGFVGYVTLMGGNLDNVQIVGPVYPTANIYRSQAQDSADNTKANYFFNSVIVNSGDCTISNCYISGSRTAIYVGAANNLLIDNTTVSGGAYANLEVAGGMSVTLKDVTTVQKETPDSYGQGKNMMGMGVVVSTGVAKINIEGELHQYNWINQSQWDALVPSTYQSAFPKFFTENTYSKYWHYRPDDSSTVYVNLAFIFACNWNTSNIIDNHTNTTMEYTTTDVSLGTNLTGYTYGGVYTVTNAGKLTDGLFVSAAYSSNNYNPVAPTFTFDNTANDDPVDETNAADPYCVYEGGVLKIGIQGASKTLDLSGVTIEKNGVVLSRTAYLNDTEVNGNSVTISVDDGTSQVLTFKANSDAGYDVNGNALDGTITYTWNVPIELAVLANPEPEWTMSGIADNILTLDVTNCYYAYYKTSQGYGEAVPIYNGISVKYYDTNGAEQNVDFSSVTTLPTGSENANANPFVYTLPDGSTLTMQYVSGFKSKASTHQFTNYNDSVYIYPQSLDSDNYVRSGVKNQDFDVKIQYTFTDPNGRTTDTITVRWYNAAADNGNVSTVQWKTFDSTNGKSSSSGGGCVTPDTLITLADGSQVMVKDLSLEDEVLVWNFFTGSYDTAPLLCIDTYDGRVQEEDVISLTFSDGTLVKVIDEHGFYDFNLNEFVYLDENAHQYIGHYFDKSGNAVQLVDVEIKKEVTTVWSPVSFGHLCYYVNGMLSMPGDVTGLFNYFEVDPETMKYDQAAMAADIEEYGLMSYEEFAEYVYPSELVYEAVNGQYFKVAVGKGLTTFEDLYALAHYYERVFPI